MPELADGAIVFGIIGALIAWRIRRRLPLVAIPLIAVLAAYAGPPIFAQAQSLWRGAGLPDITEGMAFIGLFVGLFAAVIRETKGEPRRTPIWIAALIGVIAAFAIPMVTNTLTGTYQRPSLRSDVTHCTSGMRGQAQPRQVTNTCDVPIVVGMCLSDELNPAPCRQTATLGPGESTTFDPKGQVLSYAGNRNGLTVVACRTPNRPSRWINSTGKAHEGVCLPPG